MNCSCGPHEIGGGWFICMFHWHNKAWRRSLKAKFKKAPKKAPKGGK